MIKMIRFKEIWKLYQEGKVNDETPIKSTGQPILDSKAGKNISRIIDDIVTLETANLVSQISSGSSEAELNSLEKLLAPIN
jgi:hypothetical protein